MLPRSEPMKTLSRHIWNNGNLIMQMLQNKPKNHKQIEHMFKWRRDKQNLEVLPFDM